MSPSKAKTARVHALSALATDVDGATDTDEAA
jgi:hypothetical protein